MAGTVEEQMCLTQVFFGSICVHNWSSRESLSFFLNVNKQKKEKGPGRMQLINVPPVPLKEHNFNVVKFACWGQI